MARLISTTKHNRQSGFTLLEMVIVIVLLGIVAVGVTSFLRIGTQAYVDVTNRDKLLSGARFAVERLNREIRNALPNSVRVNNGTGVQCLEFLPIVASSIYTYLPIAPVSGSNIQVVPFDDSNLSGDKLSIYPVDELAAYSELLTFTAADATTGDITLASAQSFDGKSPTQRVYFVDSPVSYCVRDNAALGQAQLYRHSNNYTANSNNTPSNNGVLMAELLATISSGYSPFNVSAATHLRNAIITTQLKFSVNGDKINFNNEVQVQNVP